MAPRPSFIPGGAMSYRPFSRMTETARRTELWRLVLGIVMVALVSFGLQQALIGLAALALSDAAYWALISQLRVADAPLGMLLLLVSLGGLGVGTVVTARVLHKRSGASLFGLLPLALSQAMRCTVAVAGLYLVIALLPPWPLAGQLVPALGFGRWLLLLPLTLLALVIQVGSEELFFRGYLQSQLGARLRHPAAWLILPSALFALGHWSPAMHGDNALLVTAWAFAFGLAAADLTARSGTLGPAFALHLVNNVVAVALVSPQGDMSGLALYHLPFGTGDEAEMRALMPLDLMGILVGWLVARLALRV